MDDIRIHYLLVQKEMVVSTNDNRLERLAQNAQQKAQEKADQLSRQLAAAQAERAARARELAHKDVELWITTIERSINDHPNGASFYWEFREGWWFYKARWNHRQKITPAIDPSKFFRARDRWSSVDVHIDIGTYVKAVNEQLGGKFELSLTSSEDARCGYFSWRRI